MARTLNTTLTELRFELAGARKQLGVSQADLAGRMDRCSKQAVWKFERESDRQPRLSTFVRYVAALGVEVVVSLEPHGTCELGDLPAALGEIRRSRDVSQGVVAAAMGTDDGALSRIERSLIDPTMETLDRYAKALDLTPKVVLTVAQTVLR